MSIVCIGFTFVTSTLAAISVGVAMFKPLISLQGFYDLHLFPERDHFDYQVSATHRASQILHVLAFVVLLFSSVLLSIQMLYVSVSRAAEDVGKQLTIWTSIMTGLGMAGYLAAVATLVSIGLHYKHIGDDLPIPTPNAKIETGAIMDIVGMLSVLMAFALVMFTVVRGDRQGYMRLN